MTDGICSKHADVDLYNKYMSLSDLLRDIGILGNRAASMAYQIQQHTKYSELNETELALVASAKPETSVEYLANQEQQQNNPPSE